MPKIEGTTDTQVTEHAAICADMTELCREFAHKEAHDIWLRELIKRGYPALANEMDSIIKQELARLISLKEKAEQE